MGQVIEIKRFCQKKYAEARAEHAEKMEQVYSLTRDTKMEFAKQLMETCEESEDRMNKYAARLRIEAKMRPLEATRADKVNIDLWDGSID